MNQPLHSILASIHQEHIIKSLNEDQQSVLLSDLLTFNATYPGGIKGYIDRAIDFLSPERSLTTPYISIDIPQGKDLIYGTDEFTSMEHLGVTELQYCCFAIVGGGIGERLGSLQPKLCLPCTLVTGESFLGFYFSYFRAIQHRFHCTVPVVIMTSHATHDPIFQELEAHHYYGLDKEHVHLLRQIEVPAITNSSAHLAIASDGHLLFKPHGHGDIHMLLHQNHLPSSWKLMGKKHLLFMQDTNILALYGFASLLGVSVTQELDFASLGIVRKPGEKVGSICRVTNSAGRQFTCNIEYNEFEALLQQVNGRGDVANANGNSCYPGNINILCVSINAYIHTLEESHGLVPEFINPKFADNKHTVFQSPARLECMMQDLPKIMHAKRSIGYCSLPRWICFSAAKNSLQNAILQAQKTGYEESMYSMEEDYYTLFRTVLQEHLELAEHHNYSQRISRIPSTPIIVLSPETALTISEMKDHIKGVIKTTEKSIVYLEGADAFVKNMFIDGTAMIKQSVENKKIHNKGWRFVESDDRLRGFILEKLESTVL